MKNGKVKIINTDADYVAEYAKLFGFNLKQLRLDGGLTQKETAEKLGVSESCYANWEQGRREPSIYYIMQLAKIFKIDMNALFDIGI